MADRKKRGSFFDFFNLDDFDEEIRRMFEDIDLKFDELKEGEPLVYGFNMRVGPDGKPTIQQFGNVKPTMKGPMKTDSRQPLVDVIERENDITIIVELPGVDKSRIKLNTTERMLTISAPGEEADFFKELKLPAAVDPKSAKASYKNGVLEVCLEKKEKSQPKAENIKIG